MGASWIRLGSGSLFCRSSRADCCARLGQAQRLHDARERIGNGRHFVRVVSAARCQLRFTLDSGICRTLDLASSIWASLIQIRTPVKPNQTMKPKAPFRNNLICLPRHPGFHPVCPASLVRLKLVRCPHSLAPTLVVLPSMSLGPPLHSLGLRTPTVMLFNASRGLSLSLGEEVYPMNSEITPAQLSPAFFALGRNRRPCPASSSVPLLGVPGAQAR